MTLVCQWCHKEFQRPGKRGPVPLYCGQSHRQRAYEYRKRDRDLTVLSHTLRAICVIAGCDETATMSITLQRPSIDSPGMEQWVVGVCEYHHKLVASPALFTPGDFSVKES